MKYELIEGLVFETTYLYRIRALKDIPVYKIKKGDFGGLVAGEHNLSQDGNSWVNKGGIIRDNACVKEDALVYGKMNEEAKLAGNACLTETGTMHEDSFASGYCTIHGNMYGHSLASDTAIIGKRASVYGEVSLLRTTIVAERATIQGAGNLYGCIVGYGVYLNLPISSFTDAVFRYDRDIASILCVGSEDGNLSLYNSKDGVRVTRGCFTGTLDEFTEKVDRTYGKDTRHWKEYHSLMEFLRFRAQEIEARR